MPIKITFRFKQDKPKISDNCSDKTLAGKRFTDDQLSNGVLKWVLYGTDKDRDWRCHYLSFKRYCV